MVQNLAGVVQHAAGGFQDDVRQLHLLKGRASDGGIEVVDVALKMFSMVETNGLRRNDRLQCVGLVRQDD